MEPWKGASNLYAHPIPPPTMATETSTMAETRISQVRIQLSSRSPDIELPEDTGPILVSTGTSLLLHSALRLRHANANANVEIPLTP